MKISQLFTLLVLILVIATLGALIDYKSNSSPCLIQVSEAPIFAVEKDKDNNVYVGVVSGTTTVPISIASTSPMAKKAKVGKSIVLCYLIK